MCAPKNDLAFRCGAGACGVSAKQARASYSSHTQVHCTCTPRTSREERVFDGYPDNIKNELQIADFQSGIFECLPSLWLSLLRLPGRCRRCPACVRRHPCRCTTTTTTRCARTRRTAHERLAPPTERLTARSRIAFAPQSFRDRKSTHQTELNVWSGPQAIKRQPPLYKQQQQPVPPPPVEWVPPVAYQAAATKPVYYDHDAEVHNPP